MTIARAPKPISRAVPAYFCRGDMVNFGSPPPSSYHANEHVTRVISSSVSRARVKHFKSNAAERSQFGRMKSRELRAPPMKRVIGFK